MELPRLLSDVLHLILDDMNMKQPEFFDLVFKVFEEKKKEYVGPVVQVLMEICTST